MLHLQKYNIKWLFHPSFFKKKKKNRNMRGIPWHEWNCRLYLPFSERGHRIPSLEQNCVFWLFWDIHLAVRSGPCSHTSVLLPLHSLFIGSGRTRWDFSITWLCWIHHHRTRAILSKGKRVSFSSFLLLLTVHRSCCLWVMSCYSTS